MIEISTDFRRSRRAAPNRDCNEACAFCNTPPSYPAILAGPEAVHAALAAEYAAGYRGVTFTGREPTLDRALPSYIAHARELGFRRIGIQTNGTTLAATLDRLCDAGLTAVEMSLHTLSPETFETLVGRASLLGHALAGIDALRARPGLEVSFIVVLTELNLATLPELVARVIERLPQVHAFTASPMAPVGDGARPEVRHLIPRLGALAAPLAAAHAVATAAGVLFQIPSRCGAALRDAARPPRAQRGVGQHAPGRVGARQAEAAVVRHLRVEPTVHRRVERRARRPGRRRPPAVRDPTAAVTKC